MTLTVLVGRVEFDSRESIDGALVGAGAKSIRRTVSGVLVSEIGVL